MRRVLCTTMLLLFAAHSHASETVGGYRCLVLVTGGAMADAELPMIIGLHYSGATPEIIAPDFDAIDFAARIVLPQGPHPRRDGFSWFPSGYLEMSVAEQTAVTLRARDEMSAFIAEAVKRFRTAGKPILTGVSYGGDLSYLIAIHHPDQISAAFPVAARFPTEWMPAANKCGKNCPPVLAMYGGDDRIVPIEGGRIAAKRLSELGFPVELRGYDGVGHDFSAQMKRDFTDRLRLRFAPECH